MRALMWIVAVLTALWCGYWFVGARVLTTEGRAALDQMQQDGRLGYGTFSIGGFPARFEADLADLSLRDPAAGWAWSVPDVAVHALAYSPNRVIAVLPPEQRLRVAGQSLALTTEDMRASVAFGLSSAVPLTHAEAVSGPLTARSDRGWSLAMEALRLAARQEEGEGFRYRLGAEATALTLDGAPAAVLAKAGLAEGPGRVRLDADAVLDRALDRSAAELPPRVTALSVRSLELDWGRLALRGAGDLRIGAEGVPEGTIQLRLANWRDLPPLLVALGLIAAAEAPALTRTMGQLALLSGGKGDLSLPLSFTGGWVALGPLPLGPAPRF